MVGFNAHERSFTIFNNEKQLVIPFFQRKYVWKEDNWNDMFDNFFEKEEPGFLGSILVQRNEIEAGSGKLDVIDGQQRLTTLSILVMAIYDSIQNDKKQNSKDEMYNALFSKEIFETEYKPKLMHSKFDKDDYDKIINFNKNRDDFKDKKDGIIGCYNYFINRLLNYSDEKKKKY